MGHTSPPFRTVPLGAAIASTPGGRCPPSASQPGSCPTRWYTSTSGRASGEAPVAMRLRPCLALCPAPPTTVHQLGAQRQWDTATPSLRLAAGTAARRQAAISRWERRTHDGAPGVVPFHTTGPRRTPFLPHPRHAASNAAAHVPQMASAATAHAVATASRCAAEQVGHRRPHASVDTPPHSTSQPRTCTRTHTSTSYHKAASSHSPIQ